MLFGRQGAKQSLSRVHIRADADDFLLPTNLLDYWLVVVGLVSTEVSSLKGRQYTPKGTQVIFASWRQSGPFWNRVHSAFGGQYHRFGTKINHFRKGTLLDSTGPMASITLKGLPDSLKERIEEMADRERRSLNQQAIYLLERAVREKVESFERTYRRFRENRGPSPLEEKDLEGLRSEESGREVDL